MGRIPIQDRLKKAAVLSFLMSLTIHIGTSYSVKNDGEPYFLNTETNITIHEGDLARLKCRVANLGPKMVNVVVWRRMNMEYPLTIGEMTFSPDNGMSVDHTPMTRSSSSWDLLIKSVKPHHAGVYECQVSSNHLNAQYITLNVIERSSIKSVAALKLTGTRYVNKGGKIHLICNATGVVRAPEAVDWFYEGNRIQSSNPKWRGRFEVLRHTSLKGKYFISELIVDHSKLEDKGHYVCRSSDLTVDSLKVHVLNADKDNLTRRRTSYSVKNDGEPYFLNTETNITIHEGDLARLKCRVANLGPKMVNVVVWRKMNMEYPLTIGEMTFSPDNGMSVDHTPMTRSSSSWDLLIKSVKPHHAGVYECQVSSNHLNAQYITLNVIERSSIKSELKLTGTRYVNKGGKIHLICNATGVVRAPEAVDWFYEGNRIQSSNPKWRGRFEVLRHASIKGKYFISELIVDHSKLEDKGHYVCRSSDLTVDSLKVHVLNADKDNLTRRVSGNEAEKGESGQFNTAPENATTLTRADVISVLVFAIVALAWR